MAETKKKLKIKECDLRAGLGVESDVDFKVPEKGIVQGQEFTAEDKLHARFVDGETIVEVRKPDNRPWWRK